MRPGRLLDLGYMVETLETSHTWSRLDQLYRGVGAAIDGALREQGTPGIVICHLSHAYRDGASLYFTFLAPGRPGEEIEHWHAVKRSASEAIVGCGATITHHHELLRAAEERLDPAGIMNPGKLLTS